MNLRQAFRSRWFAPRVAHRLPGRLRVHVPLLTRVPERGKPIAGILEPLFLLPAGIESVEAGFVTGNMLIRYDRVRLSEEHVVAWTNTLWHLVCEHHDRLAALPQDRVAVVAARMREVLQQALGNGYRPGERIELPADVWD